MNTISVQSITDRPIIDAIAPDDFMLIGDASDNNVVKRVLVSSLKNYFAASSPTPTPTPTGFALRIDCGSNTSYTDTFGNVWSADIHRTAGTGFTSESSVNSPNSIIYQSETYDFEYQIPLTNGSYTVNLHFAEVDSNAQNRRFSVLFNSQIVLPNYCIFEDVGFGIPIVKSLPVTTTNGTLVIGAINHYDPKRAKICAIEILG